MPNQEEQDVNQPDSSLGNEAVNEAVEQVTTQEESATPNETVQAQAPEAQVAPTVKPTLDPNLYDPRGVPWQNVAKENERKMAELLEKVDKITTQVQPQQRKYTIQELETIALQNPDLRPQVEEEKAKLIQEGIRNSVMQEVESKTKLQRDEAVKQQVFNQVIQDFPEVAIKDQYGRFIGWNNASPLVQKMGEYYASPDLAGRPDGLALAAKLAFADTVMQQLPSTQKQVQKLKANLKKVEQKTFVEGGGRKVTESVPAQRRAVQQAAQTGDMKDAAIAMRGIMGL